MKSSVLLAIVSKLVEEKIEESLLSRSTHSSRQGPRGPQGEQGEPGKPFSLDEHGPIFQKWVSEAVQLATELTPEKIELLRGPSGKNGRDGRDFKLEDVENTLKSWIKESSLKLSDLSEEEIESLRGPPGADGLSFNFEENRDEIGILIASHINFIKDELKLNFSDLGPEEIAQLRGPRGQRGRPGKDFVFDEHLEFFQSLKLKFSDLTDEEKESLKLRFSDLTEGERESLRLKFEQLTQDQKLELRGPRGQRGKQGPQGIQGEKGDTGEKGDKGDRGPIGMRGLPGLEGPRGFSGPQGSPGQDGKDAPTIVDVRIDQFQNSIEFVFVFSDNSIIRTRTVTLPSGATGVVYVTSGGGGTGSGGGSTFDYLFGSGVPSNGTGTDGDVYQDTDNGDQYKKISGSWVLQDNLTGPAGANGTNGTNGTNGVDGADGSQYLFGSGVPSNGLGVDGDVYQDTSNGDQYKKIAGSWAYQGTIGGGAANEIVTNVACDSSVFVGAAVRMNATGVVALTMDQWAQLSTLPTMDASTYATVAVNALADNYQNSNVFGIVESKSSLNLCNIRVAGVSGAIFLGLDIFEEYYLSDVYPGQIVALPQAPTATGSILVRLGLPFSPTRFFYQRGDRIVRA